MKTGPKKGSKKAKRDGAKGGKSRPSLKRRRRKKGAKHGNKKPKR